jgi:hypothetical protein
VEELLQWGLIVMGTEPTQDNRMFHSLIFFFSAIVLLLWLVAAGLSSGYFIYYLGAVLVVGILFLAFRSK